MKKIYLILASTLLGTAIFAQSNLKAKDISQTPVKSSFINNGGNAVSRTTIVNKKVNFNDDHVNYYSSTSAGFYRTIFPDSTTPAEYSGATIGYTYIHGAAQIFDLASQVVNGSIGGSDDGFDPTQTATLDSIKLYAYYAKGSYNYTDTLEISVVDYIGDFRLTDAYYAPWGADTIRAFAIERDTITDTIKNAIAKYKVALNLADTLSNGTMLVKLPAGATVNRRFAIDVRFKPGGSYAVTDTINKQLGMFRLYTSEPNGTGTLMSYIKNDRSGAAFFTKFAKYGTPKRRYYGNVYGYPATQSDNFEIDAILSQTNPLSINEEVKDADLFQNFPNPSNGITTVRYSLQNEANVTFEMMDVTGKRIFSTLEGKKNPGTYSLEINTAELNSGIYFYSILVNGNKITKKMIITK
jgi:hypothetical protein